VPDDPQPSDEPFGDPIPEVFPPDDPAARFVVAMSMANNDIDRALADLIRSVDEDRPDFTYRVRLLTGHLVEAIDAQRLQPAVRGGPRAPRPRAR